MRVKIWGARGSIPASGPHTQYYGGNTACLSVATDSGEVLVLDAGSGIRALGKSLVAGKGAQPAQAAVLLSHFHWDHIMGIPFFQPLYGANNRLAFFSYRHSNSSFQDVVESTMGAPYFPISMRQVASRREFYEISDQCFQIGAVHVMSRRLNHPQGCLGYRLECGGRVVTYATDHESDGGVGDSNLLALAAGADLLIVDAQYTQEEYEGCRRGWGHGTWETAVEIARRCAVSQLLLFHHDPDRSDVELRTIVRQAQGRFTAVEAAAEGMEVYLSERSALQEQAQKPLPTGEEWVVKDCFDHPHVVPSSRARWAS
jgi:phosphoribosyl 1,2-cyclic phosphodiesterase